MRRFTVFSAALSAAVGSLAYLSDCHREGACAIAKVSAASPSANPSAPISRAQIVNKPAGSSPAGDGAFLSRALRHREAGAAAQSGLDLASQAAPRSSAFEQMTPELRVPGLERVPSAGRPMARAQGMRPGRPPLGRESKQGGGRSLPQSRTLPSKTEAPSGRRSGAETLSRAAEVKTPRDTRNATAGETAIYEVTAYSHGCTLPTSGREPHAQRAANGRWPIAEVTAAADTTLHPFGTEVIVEGLGFRTVGDRGAAIKGRKLDLFVDTCREARAFGRRFLRVFPVPPATTREARGFEAEPAR